MKIFFHLIFLFPFLALAQVPGQLGEAGTNAVPDMPMELVGREKNAGYYQDKGKFGFVYPENNRQPAIYDALIYTSNGYIVRIGKKYGLADHKGQLVGKMEFDSIAANAYDSKSAFIFKKKGLYGTMRPDGTQILAPKYHKILFSSQTDAFSFIEDKSRKIRLLFNESGKLLPEEITSADIYTKKAIVKAGGKFGVVSDRVLIPITYDSIFIKSEPERNQNISLKTKRRNPIVNFSSPANEFVVRQGNLFGLLNGHGNVIFPADNDRVFTRNIYGYHTVEKNKKFGIYFIASGKKTEIQFDEVYSDGLGYAMASKGKKAGAFNLQGELVIPFEYDPHSIYQYTPNLRVAKDKKRGIVDKQGKVLIPPVYDDVDTFWGSGMGSLIKVKSGENLGIINMQNEVIIPLEYNFIDDLNGLFRVVQGAKTERKFGLFTQTGKVVLPAEYKWIGRMTGDNTKILHLEKEKGSINFLDTENKLVFEENISGFHYVTDANNLVNPYGSLLIVTAKNGKSGLLNVVTAKLQVPMEYDEIIQKFAGNSRTYFSVRNGKKFGLIDDRNKVLIPIVYDAISLDLADEFHRQKMDPDMPVVVKKGTK